MLYQNLAECYARLESTSKRLEKTYILYKFLKSVDPKELESATLLVQGRVFPAWDQREIGVASKMVVKAIAVAAGYSHSTIENKWRELGDLGLVAEKLIETKKQATLFQKPLTIKKVFDNLQKLASLEGAKSVDLKIKTIAELLTSAKPLEVKYIIRTILSELRVGIGEGTLRDAIAWAFFPKVIGIFFKCPHCGNWVPNSSTCSECGKRVNFSFKTEIENFEKSKEKRVLKVESLEEVKDKELKNYDFIFTEDERTARDIYNYIISIVQDAYNLLTDFSLVASEAIKGSNALKNVELKPGRPIKVMLAIKVPTLKDGFEACGYPSQLEYKYDGFRVHIHKTKNLVKVFTRRLEDVTHQFPDIVNVVKNIKAESFIVDGEAVGYNKKTGKSLPFQQISQRIKRKYDIRRMVKELPVEVNLFDIVYYNGKSILKRSLKERRAILEKIVKEEKGKVLLSVKKITSSEKEAREFFEESISHGNEGIMFKKLDAEYKPGARVGYMVKYKEVMETLDLVIVGADWGEGKRAKWLSSFYIACKDENNNLLTIGKVGTGLKEKDEEGLSFGKLTELLKPLIIEQKGRYVKVRPDVIVEVHYEEIQKSPEYESGFALRFPRIVRLRPDKPLDEIADLSRVKFLYSRQRGRNKK